MQLSPPPPKKTHTHSTIANCRKCRTKQDVQNKGTQSGTIKHRNGGNMKYESSSPETLENHQYDNFSLHEARATRGGKKPTSSYTEENVGKSDIVLVEPSQWDQNLYTKRRRKEKQYEGETLELHDILLAEETVACFFAACFNVHAAQLVITPRTFSSLTEDYELRAQMLSSNCWCMKSIPAKKRKRNENENCRYAQTRQTSNSLLGLPDSTPPSLLLECATVPTPS